MSFWVNLWKWFEFIMKIQDPGEPACSIFTCEFANKVSLGASGVKARELCIASVQAHRISTSFRI